MQDGFPLASYIISGCFGNRAIEPFDFPFEVLLFCQIEENIPNSNPLFYNIKWRENQLWLYSM